MSEVVFDDEMGNPLAGSGLVIHDAVSALLSEHDAMAASCYDMLQVLTDKHRKIMRFFSLDYAQLKEENAMPKLAAFFWSRAMELTDLLEAMPEKRRNEWQNAIREHKCPPFTEKIVRDTFCELLASRTKFLAEKVDGLFRGLSGEHVTNRPEGFWKRMILNTVFYEYGVQNSQKVGLIHDLRSVIARFMKRDAPYYSATSDVLYAMKGNWGEWYTLDGGALRMRLYMRGTVHLELHPDMAYRLNMLLAQLYPQAIPPKFREKSPRACKDIPPMQQPLPYEVLKWLADLEPASYLTDGYPRKRQIIPNTWTQKGSGLKESSEAVRMESRAVLESLGATRKLLKEHGMWVWEFPYPAGRVLQEVIASGRVPHDYAHQYFPTPKMLAERCIELASIQPGMTCLEPQAGLGGLASLMPRERTTCVELAKLRCLALREMGFQEVIEGDFLAWSASNYTRYDRIVMNPPFDQGRWRAHLEAAGRMLAPGGRLVAILPSGAGKLADKLLPGLRGECPETHSDVFKSASIDVAILVFDRPAEEKRPTQYQAPTQQLGLL